MKYLELTKDQLLTIAKVFEWAYTHDIDVSLRKFVLTNEAIPELVFSRGSRFISVRITKHDLNNLKEYLMYECEDVAHQLLIRKPNL